MREQSNSSLEVDVEIFKELAIMYYILAYEVLDLHVGGYKLIYVCRCSLLHSVRHNEVLMSSTMTQSHRNTMKWTNSRFWKVDNILD